MNVQRRTGLLEKLAAGPSPAQLRNAMKLLKGEVGSSTGKALKGVDATHMDGVTRATLGALGGPITASATASNGRRLAAGLRSVAGGFGGGVAGTVAGLALAGVPGIAIGTALGTLGGGYKALRRTGTLAQKQKLVALRKMNRQIKRSGGGGHELRARFAQLVKQLKSEM